MVLDHQNQQGAMVISKIDYLTHTLECSVGIQLGIKRMALKP